VPQTEGKTPEDLPQILTVAQYSATAQVTEAVYSEVHVLLYIYQHLNDQIK